MACLTFRSVNSLLQSTTNLCKITDTHTYIEVVNLSKSKTILPCIALQGRKSNSRSCRNKEVTPTMICVQKGINAALSASHNIRALGSCQTA
jgi:hypothetical protein